MRHLLMRPTIGIKRRFSAYVGVAVLSATAMLVIPSATSAQTAPAIGGGYNDVTAIPVNDPAIKSIGAALFKPTGAGPFAAVIYMAPCGGVDPPVTRALQKTITDHLLAKGTLQHLLPRHGAISATH